jgi:hypothetical protein
MIGSANPIKTPIMANTTPPPTDDLLQAAPDEGDAFKSLDHRIESIYGRNGSAQLVDAEGNATKIPDAALHALRLIVRRMAHGERIALVAHGDELSTQQAADILHVSRPHLVQTVDLLAYRTEREATRHAKLDELARISEELPGGYR